MREFEVGSAHDNRTAEQFLRENGVSAALLRRLKRTENGITRNGSLLRSIDIVHCGDVVIIKEDEEQTRPEISRSCVPVIYCDDDLMVFDKPSGMPVHRSIKHYDDTLENVFLSCFDTPKSFRAINRLDKDTTGLCICALSAYSTANLIRSYQKKYYAVVCGITPESGVIDLPIDRENESIIRRIVSESGKRAVTEYRRLDCNDRYSFVEVILHTGRTHQIRVHFSHIGFPLAGDILYGGSCEDIGRQALHCGHIELAKPDGKTIVLDSPIPEDMKSII